MGNSVRFSRNFQTLSAWTSLPTRTRSTRNTTERHVDFVPRPKSSVFEGMAPKHHMRKYGHRGQSEQSRQIQPRYEGERDDAQEGSNLQ